ncbi:MAG TPA: hypothetical protein VFT55_05080 [Planctomycetota bacterium]|nr:hypothetical protein [Planctomycetota bacterium]
MMPMPRWLVCVCFPVSYVAAQATLVVPGSFPTIQAAIAAAQPSDTVLVMPGTWFERIDFLGKAITVRSAAGAAVTTIDGSQLGSVVTFTTNETPASVLEGFTITNGLGATVVGLRSAAGGIQCVGASPTIRRCVIRANQGGTGASVGGTTTTPSAGGPGGILAQGSALQLIECEIDGNQGGQGGTGAATGPFSNLGARGGAGGAFFNFDVAGAPPELVGCRFTNNSGGGGGAASPTGSGGRGGDGGFELFTTVAARLLQCVVRGNTGGNGGSVAAIAGLGGHGGFDISAPTALAITPMLLRSCAIVNNTGGNAGIGSNAHGGNGGGMTGPTQFTAIGCTFAGNVGGTPLVTGAVCGGLSVGGWMVSSAALRNCILWGNTRGGLPSDLDVNGIAANATSIDVGATQGTVFGSGIISVNPLFVNLAGGDVHLTAASPCRHAGTAVANQPLFDIDGDPRTVGPATDMGADEWDGLVGTREDLVLDLAVNGVFSAAVVTSSALGGDVVTVRVLSPGGSLATAPVLVGLEPWLQPVAPVGPAFLPELQLSPAAWVFLVLPGGVGPAGLTFGTAMPAGLQGFAFRLQAFAFTSDVKNGVFAATAARDLLL